MRRGAPPARAEVAQGPHGADGSPRGARLQTDTEPRGTAPPSAVPTHQPPTSPRPARGEGPAACPRPPTPHPSLASGASGGWERERPEGGAANDWGPVPLSPHLSPIACACQRPSTAVSATASMEGAAVRPARLPRPVLSHPPQIAPPRTVAAYACVRMNPARSPRHPYDAHAPRPGRTAERRGAAAGPWGTGLAGGGAARSEQRDSGRKGGRNTTSPPVAHGAARDALRTRARGRSRLEGRAERWEKKVLEGKNVNAQRGARHSTSRPSRCNGSLVCMVVALLQPGGCGVRSEDTGTGSDRGWKGGRKTNEKWVRSSIR
jgi:hypothetical protein